MQRAAQRSGKPGENAQKWWESFAGEDGPLGQEMQAMIDEEEQQDGFLAELFEDMKTAVLNVNWAGWQRETMQEAMGVYVAAGPEAARALALANFEQGFHATMFDGSVEARFCHKKFPGAFGEERPPPAWHARWGEAGPQSLIQKDGHGEQRAPPPGFSAWWDALFAGDAGALRGAYDLMLEDLQGSVFGFAISQVVEPEFRKAAGGFFHSPEVQKAFKENGAESAQPMVLKKLLEWKASAKAAKEKEAWQRLFCTAALKSEREQPPQ